MLAVHEFGEVGRWSRDEGVHQVRGVQRILAAEGGNSRTARKASATQEQRNVSTRNQNTTLLNASNVTEDTTQTKKLNAVNGIIP